MNPPRSIHLNLVAGKRRGEEGSILLEVLLALALFAAAAAVVTIALNASLESLERQKLAAQAVNLSASVMAEVQLGIRPPSSESARPLDPPFQDWTWELVLTPDETTTGDATGLTRVEVVIRNQKSPVVQRLAQVISFNNGVPAAPAEPVQL